MSNRIDGSSLSADSQGERTSAGVQVAEPAMGTQGGDDAEVVLGGYQPELKRTLNQFQVFAISFAFISVAVGIFATYSVVLQTGGPVAIWLWVLVAVRADPGGAGLRVVRRPDLAERLLLPMGLPAGQPEDRIGIRLADRLLSGDRRGGGWTMPWPTRRSCPFSTCGPTRPPARADHHRGIARSGLGWCSLRRASPA